MPFHHKHSRACGSPSGASGNSQPARRERKLRATVAMTTREAAASTLAATFEFTSAAFLVGHALGNGAGRRRILEHVMDEGRRSPWRPAYGCAVAIGIFLKTNTMIVSELWSESSLGLAGSPPQPARVERPLNSLVPLASRVVPRAPRLRCARTPASAQAKTLHAGATGSPAAGGGAMAEPRTDRKCAHEGSVRGETWQ
jgi:hypothetical protein